MKKIGEELHSAKRDTTSYVQIMLRYYKASKKISDNKLPPPTITNFTSKNEEIGIKTNVRKNITEELNDIELVKYATRVDDDCEDAITNKLIDSSDARSFLLSDRIVGQYYNDLMKQFPTCLFVFATTVSSHSYSAPIHSQLDAECIVSWLKWNL